MREDIKTFEELTELDKIIVKTSVGKYILEHQLNDAEVNLEDNKGYKMMDDIYKAVYISLGFDEQSEYNEFYTNYLFALYDTLYKANKLEDIDKVCEYLLTGFLLCTEKNILSELEWEVLFRELLVNEHK